MAAKLKLNEIDGKVSLGKEPAVYIEPSRENLPNPYSGKIGT